MLTVLNLGAGVQSSTLALMAADGEIANRDLPYEALPDLAVFADTGWEPKAVYEWLDWLEQKLPFPVFRVKFRDIREGELTDAGHMPWFVDNDGVRGITHRQCTHRYKIDPIEKFIKREVLGLHYRARWPKYHCVDQWFGISLDEIQRMRVSQKAYCQYRYPLVDMRISRQDCIQWMERSGYPKPPRSACIGCPYHSDDEWRNIKDNQPEEWQQAVEFERQFQQAGRTNHTPYLHASLKPLDEVDLSTPADRGQLSLLDECEGMCGV